MVTTKDKKVSGEVFLQENNLKEIKLSKKNLQRAGVTDLKTRPDNSINDKTSKHDRSINYTKQTFTKPNVSKLTWVEDLNNLFPVKKGLDKEEKKEPVSKQVIKQVENIKADGEKDKSIKHSLILLAILKGGVNRAIVLDEASGKTFIVSEGDIFNKYKVLTIKDNGVICSVNEKKVKLNFDRKDW
ncbi:hypothetical protein [Halothermothrix orenii]|nr:hypothetical protein [Halothermothrix orenii]